MSAERDPRDRHLAPAPAGTPEPSAASSPVEVTSSYPVAKAILHELDSFAVILGPDLQLLYANPAARQSTHVSGIELSDSRFLAQAKQVLNTGTATSHVNEDETPVRIQFIPLPDRHLVVLVEDLGEEQRVQAMRRDFIANVSHELKTPISAISLLAEAVVEGADDPEVVREFSKQLLKQARRLGNLTRDIIQLSEAQSDLRPEDRQPVDLRELVVQEVEAHRDLATGQDVSVELVLPEPASRPAITAGVPSALSTAVDNLLSNAIRYSPPGSRVRVTMTFEKDTLMVTVADQGEGIALEHQHRIFERFYRVDRSRSREGGGTGLGLSIAHHIMRGHGGAIDLWSRPGEGSQFTLTFPLLRPSQLPADSQKREPDEPANPAS